jgi:hypothetical protein
MFRPSANICFWPMGRMSEPAEPRDNLWAHQADGLVGRPDSHACTCID